MEGRFKLSSIDLLEIRELPGLEVQICLSSCISNSEGSINVNSVGQEQAEVIISKLVSVLEFGQKPNSRVGYLWNHYTMLATTTSKP